MRIYMSFRMPEGSATPAPSLTWLRSSMLLELMGLDGAVGKVSLAELAEGIVRARAALEAPVGRPFARKERERQSGLVVLNLLEQARCAAEQKGASEFVWREDW